MARVDRYIHMMSSICVLCISGVPVYACMHGIHASLNDKLMHADCFCIGCMVEGGLDNLHGLSG